MYNSGPRPATAFSVVPGNSELKAMTYEEQQAQQRQALYLRDTSAAGASAYVPLLVTRRGYDRFGGGLGMMGTRNGKRIGCGVCDDGTLGKN
jgi:hypothetical protein